MDIVGKLELVLVMSDIFNPFDTLQGGMTQKPASPWMWAQYGCPGSLFA